MCATAFVLFGVLDLVEIIEFPDSMLIVVLAQPPTWIAWLIVIVLPILCVGFGIFMFMNGKMSTAILFVVSIIYSVMHVWAAAKLPYWGQLTQGQALLMPGLIEMKIVGGLCVFVAASIYLFFVLKNSRGQGEPPPV